MNAQVRHGRVSSHGRNRDKLCECHHIFASKAELVIKNLEEAGFRPRIQQAWRSPEEQLEAFVGGHSKLRYGFHNVTGLQEEREALAVDLLDDDAPVNPSTMYLLHLASAAAAHDLEGYGVCPRSYLMQQSMPSRIRCSMLL
jgi:hypothetical protein